MNSIAGRKIQRSLAIFFASVMATQSSLPSSLAGAASTTAGEPPSAESTLFDNHEPRDWVELLVSEPPKLSGAQALFNLARTDLRLRSSVSSLIANSSQLTAQSKEGAYLFTNYLNNLKGWFGQENLGLVTQPFHETLRRVEEISHNDKRRRPVPLTETEAQHQAWESTQRQFPISLGLSPDQLERSAILNQGHFAALNFFRREWARLQQLDESRLRPAPPSVADFKRKILDQIDQIRLINMSTYLVNMLNSGISEIRNLRLIPRGPGRDSLHLAQLHSVDSFAEEDTVSHSLEENKIGALREFINSRSAVLQPQSRATDQSEKYDLRAERMPVANFSGRAVTLRTRSGESVVLSAGDFDRIFCILGDLKGDHPGNQTNPFFRLILEATSRELLLRSVQDFISRVFDPDLEALSDRLRERVQNIEASRRMPTAHPIGSLTEWINRFGIPSINRDGGGLAEIELYGLFRHPRYWAFRDSVAELGQTPKFGQPRANPSLQDASQIAAEAQRIWSRTMRSNEESRKDKIRKFIYVPLALYTILTAAALLPTQSQNSPAKSAQPPSSSSSFQMPQALQNPIDDALRMLPDWFQRAMKRPAETMNPMDEDFSLGNYSIPEGDNGKGKLFYTFTQLPTDRTVPSYRYLNLINTQHFPAGFFNHPDAADPNREPPSVRQISPIYSSKHSAEAYKGKLLVIEQQIASTPERGRVAIPSFSSWQIDELEVWVADPKLPNVQHLLSPNTDYRIYRLSTHGLNYIELSERYRNFRVYLKISLVPGLKPLTLTLPNDLKSSTLQPTAERLMAIGAAEASTALANLMKATQTVSLRDIEARVRNTGVYVYNGKDTDPRADVWTTLSSFVSRGVLYYQCTGGNTVLFETLKNAIQQHAKYKDVVKVEPLNGFLVSNAAGVSAIDYHRHTLVLRTDQPETFVELDGTPTSNGRGQRSDIGFGAWGPGRRTPELVNDHGNPLYDDGDSAATGSSDQFHQQLLARITKLQFEAGAALEKYRSSVEEQAQISELALDLGPRSLALAQLVIEHLHGRTDLAQLSEMVLAIMAKMPPQRPLSSEQKAWLSRRLKTLRASSASDAEVVSRLFQVEFKDLESLLKSIDKNHYLNIEEIRVALTNLTQSLAAISFADDSAANRCADHLRRSSP